MIRIENTDTYGWEAAVRGMRNPMNSWDKSDSYYQPANFCDSEYVIGEDDLDLMKRLVKAGTDHSKFMRMIGCSCDILAPIYWFKEFDTYKVGTVANSCSTMHKIHSKEFTLMNFSTDHLDDFSFNRLFDTIEHLNICRKKYIETNDKKWWWQMIQLLPMSYNQRRTVMLNYQVLRNMYHARKNHKLDEWHDFCDWIESLPYSELITGGDE